MSDIAQGWFRPVVVRFEEFDGHIGVAPFVGFEQSVAPESGEEENSDEK